MSTPRSTPSKHSRPLSITEQEARIRAADAVRLKRANPAWSLTRAAREAHTKPATVRRYLPTAVVRDEKGRWQTKPGDRESFWMRVVSVELGVTEAKVTGSNKRRLVGRHQAAIGTYLRTGDQTGLQAADGQKVAGLTLETDPKVIRELFRRGEMAFLEIYALAH